MDLVLTTPDQLRQIVTECLDNHKPAPVLLPEPEYLYSIKALSDFLDCSPTTAQKLKNSGKIRYRQFGRKCVFNTLEILEDLKRKK